MVTDLCWYCDDAGNDGNDDGDGFVAEHRCQFDDNYDKSSKADNNNDDNGECPTTCQGERRHQQPRRCQAVVVQDSWSCLTVVELVLLQGQDFLRSCSTLPVKSWSPRAGTDDASCSPAPVAGA